MVLGPGEAVAFAAVVDAFSAHADGPTAMITAAGPHRTALRWYYDIRSLRQVRSSPTDDSWLRIRELLRLADVVGDDSIVSTVRTLQGPSLALRAVGGATYGHAPLARRGPSLPARGRERSASTTAQCGRFHAFRWGRFLAITLTPNTIGSIDLDTFVEAVERELQTDDVDALCAVAPAFSQLLNNRRVITDFVEAELRGWRGLDGGSEYVGPTLVMVRRPRFMVRANIWVAPDPKRPAPKPEDPGFGYLIPHDHNFAFMTGGYYGPGYTTFLYEYEPSRVKGEIREHVPLHYLETTDCHRVRSWCIGPRGTSTTKSTPGLTRSRST